MPPIIQGTAAGLITALILAELSPIAAASPQTFLFSEGWLTGQADTTPDIATARRAAETIAHYGRQRQDPAILLGALEVLLATGATLKADDPWGAPEMLAEIEALAHGNDRLIKLLSDLESRSKGALQGPIRDDLTLDPGATLRIKYLVAAGELMDIEVRLKHGSDGANLDLAVYDVAGTLIVYDTGPDTGILGVGAYIRFIPETCARFTVEIRNTGTAPASFALVAARAITSNCVELR